MRRSVAMCAACLVAFLGMSAHAAVKPNNLFSDHMVLQAGMSDAVWGTADPGEQVTVTLDDQKQSATAGPDGKWTVRLTDLKAGGPMEMTINSQTIHDVLVGEVWLGSGQSNMQFPVGASPVTKAYNGVTNMEQEIAQANYPQIRMYTVKTLTSAKPLDDTQGEWQVCTPDIVPAWSAIGYFFSRDLQQQINKPIGFINSSFGASTAEAWVSKDTLDADPRFAGMMKAFQTSLDTFAAQQQAPTTLPGPGTRRARPPRNPYSDQHSPTVLWNAMLVPLQPYAIRGAVWYQGESVVGGTAADKLYAHVMEALVTSWRKQWGEGDFPFYVCQLAGQDANSNNPIIRESQAAILSLPNTGMAVLIDIGEKKNVHPKDKQDVGDRLSRIALANVYGQKMEYSGPMYDSMTVEGNAIRVKFTHVGNGLVAKGGPLKTFTLAGDDGKFVPADAKIDGETVIVSSPDVAAPKNVRYAWMNWPEGCNLYNAADLPAAPFRTDKD